MANTQAQATSSKGLIAKIENNAKLSVGILLAIVVIVGIYFAYTKLYIAPREEKAEAAIFKGETYFGMGAFNEALNGDNKGYVGFLRIIKDYSGTKTANLASGYAGICYAQLGKYKEAIEYLNDFSANDAIIAPAVIGAKGDCYVELGQLDDAISAYLEAVDKADGKAEVVNYTISPIFLQKASLVYEKQGKKDKALELYQTIKDKYIQSYAVQNGEVDKYIQKLQ